MADQVFVSARRAIKNAMSKMYHASVKLDLAELGDRNFVRSSCELNAERANVHKQVLMSRMNEQGYAWPSNWIARGEYFAPRKIVMG